MMVDQDTTTYTKSVKTISNETLFLYYISISFFRELIKAYHRSKPITIELFYFKIKNRRKKECFMEMSSQLQVSISVTFQPRKKRSTK